MRTSGSAEARLRAGPAVRHDRSCEPEWSAQVSEQMLEAINDRPPVRVKCGNAQTLRSRHAHRGFPELWAQGSPPSLRTAQAAMQSAEVQEMLRRLSAHGLGICMPHRHDGNTDEISRFPTSLCRWNPAWR